MCILWFWTNNLEGRRGRGSYVRLTNSVIASAASHKTFVVCAIWTRPFVYNTHWQEHTHARPQPFPWQDVEATSSRKSHYSALLPFEVRHVLFRSLWQCVCTRASQRRPRTEQTDLLKRQKYECYKTILFSMDADHINMLSSSILSVCEFCLTAHPTFSQPLKDPRVPFRRTTWRSPYTVRESSSSPAWWALWWCAGWGTQQRNPISGASRLSTNWASRSLWGAR